MPRSANPYYADPGAEIGAGLGRALFGDPNARARQQQLQAEAELRNAQTGEATSHAGLYDAQASGRRIQNDGAMSLPQMLAAYAGSFDTPAPVAPVAVAPPPMADHAIAASILPPGIAPPQPVIAPQPAPDEVVGTGQHPHQTSHTSALAALLAAAAQAQGDKVNPSALAASIAALSGSDEDARRSMASMGHSPSKDFALTTTRADDIAGNAADATYRKDTAVAGINHANDRAVASINHANDVPVAMINNRDDIPVAKIAAQGRVDVQTAKDGAPGKPGKAKPISAASMKMVDAEITNRGLTGDPQDMMFLRKAAATNYQTTGNPVAAVDDALHQTRAYVANRKRTQAAGPTKAPPAGAPAGTKQAPDGNFYAPDPSRPGKFVRVDG